MDTPRFRPLLAAFGLQGGRGCCSWKLWGAPWKRFLIAGEGVGSYGQRGERASGAGACPLVLGGRALYFRGREGCLVSKVCGVCQFLARLGFSFRRAESLPVKGWLSWYLGVS